MATSASNSTGEQRGQQTWRVHDGLNVGPSPARGAHASARSRGGSKTRAFSAIMSLSPANPRGGSRDAAGRSRGSGPPGRMNRHSDLKVRSASPAQPLPDHDAMAVDGSQTELAHAPRLVLRGLGDVAAARANALAVTIDIIDRQVRKVRMISQVTRR